MALDKLVDSTQLDGNLTSIANAIRAKGGTSAQLAFPQGFVDAVEAIETGGGELLTNDAASINTIKFKYGSVPELIVDFSKMTKISTLMQVFDTVGANLTKITITPPTSVKDTHRICYSNTGLVEFDINGTLYARVNSSANEGFFGACAKLARINGKIDLSHQTRTNFYAATNYQNAFYNDTKLQTVSFVPGSMQLATTSWVLSWLSSLSNDSLVSIANALPDTYSGTITFHATPKARLTSIMGTVSSDGTLSTFEIDENGTMSLLDFLTTVKGATIA
jgi:hypothetical protein